MHPRLAPGIHVLRRRDGLLQVGLDPERAVVLPDEPRVRRSLDRVTGADLTGTPDRHVVARLEPLLVAPSGGRSGRVSVTGFGHSAGGRLVHTTRELLDQTGLRPAHGRAYARILVGVGEPPRPLVDDLSRSGVPYLVVRLVEGVAVIGPFVVPGRTACLRCLDAHATDADPSWPLLLEQYVDASARDRCDGTSEPVDPMLAALACAWAARDVTTFLQGHRPPTWSATLRCDPLLQDVRATTWLRHPACGCSWAGPGTMAG